MAAVEVSGLAAQGMSPSLPGLGTIAARIDTKGCFTEYDVALTEFLGIHSDALKGKCWLDLVAEDNLEACRSLWETRLVSNAESDLSLEFPLRSGELRRALRSPAERGLVWLNFCFSLNRAQMMWDVEISHVSQRRAVFEHLREVERQFFQGNLVVGLFDWDIQADHLVLSPTFRDQLLGLAPNETCDTLAQYVRLVHAEDSGTTMLALERAILQGQPYTVDYRVRHRSGMYRYLRVRGVCQSVADGPAAAQRMCGSAMDVTETVDLQQRLAAARDDLVRALALKEQFMSNMSHEIRTPLNGIIGTTQFLLDTTLSAEQRELAQTIRASAESLLSVANDVLDFIKLETGQLSIEPVPVNLRSLLQDVLQLVTAAANRKGLSVRLSVAPDVPDIVRTDPLRLRQILGNLMSNAVKFTIRGGAVLQVTVLRRESNIAVLRLSVMDTGIGIPPDYLAHIFEKFTQADTRSTRRFGGTGMGLAISKQLCHALGGDLNVHSEVGHGSDFFVVLPLEVLDSETARRDSAQSSGTELRGVRALVVMPEQAPDRRRVIMTLNALEMHVDTVESPTVALEMLLNEPAYRVVIADSQLPGVEQLSHALVHSDHLRAQLVLCTPTVVPAADRLPADAYVASPVRRASLQGALSSLVRGMQVGTGLNVPVPLHPPLLELPDVVSSEEASDVGSRQGSRRSSIVQPPSPRSGTSLHSSEHGGSAFHPPKLSPRAMSAAVADALLAAGLARCSPSLTGEAGLSPAASRTSLATADGDEGPAAAQPSDRVSALPPETALSGLASTAISAVGQEAAPSPVSAADTGPAVRPPLTAVSAPAPAAAAAPLAPPLSAPGLLLQAAAAAPVPTPTASPLPLPVPAPTRVRKPSPPALRLPASPVLVAPPIVAPSPSTASPQLLPNPLGRRVVPPPSTDSLLGGHVVVTPPPGAEASGSASAQGPSCGSTPSMAADGRLSVPADLSPRSTVSAAIASAALPAGVVTAFSVLSEQAATAGIDTPRTSPPFGSAPASGAPSSASPLYHRPAASLRVLIAEDNPVNSKLAVRMMQKLGFVPDVALNGAEAVTMHRAHPYDVILMDCHMPECDGYQATSMVRELDAAAQRHTVIVAMTADVLPTNRIRCQEAGMDDFFGKPIQIGILANVLRRLNVLPPLAPPVPDSGVGLAAVAAPAGSG